MRGFARSRPYDRREDGSGDHAQAGAEPLDVAIVHHPCVCMEDERACRLNGVGQFKSEPRAKSGGSFGHGGCQIDDPPTFEESTIARRQGFIASAQRTCQYFGDGHGGHRELDLAGRMRLEDRLEAVSKRVTLQPIEDRSRVQKQTGRRREPAAIRPVAWVATVCVLTGATDLVGSDRLRGKHLRIESVRLIEQIRDDNIRPASRGQTQLSLLKPCGGFLDGLTRRTAGDERNAPCVW